MPKLETRSCAWVPLPLPGAPKRRTGPGRKERSAGAVDSDVQFEFNVSCLPTSSPTNTAALGREAVIVAHNELRFDLLNSVHGYADYDQQRGAPEVEVNAESVGHPGWKCVKDAANQRNVVEVNTTNKKRWNDRDDDQIDGADQRDPCQN